MRALLPVLVLVACQPDPLLPELEARPEAVNFGPAEVGPEGAHERVRFVNVGETTVRIDRWTMRGEGAARLSLDGPDLPLDVPPDGRAELILRLLDPEGLRAETAEITVEFRGYSGVGELGELAVPVSVVMPGRCDVDEDGFAAERCGGRDCDDRAPAVHPDATEVCNEVDDDCDGQIDPVDTEGSGAFYADTDGDGFGDPLTEIFRCEGAPGEVADGTDCDDARFHANPGATERCNELDDDCDGVADEDAINAFTLYTDADGDGFGADGSAASSCHLPDDGALVDGDCDDANAEVRPGRFELCNGKDDDCDGQIDEAAIDAANWFPDADGDGAGGVNGRVRACAAPTGFLATATDCDDTDPAVLPGGTEVCNGKDDDCDGLLDEAGEGVRATWYRDADGDAHGDPRAAQAACGTPAGYVQSPVDDCDDVDAQAFPGAPERCNGKDDDCDGVVDDGAACVEICGNGGDDDLDGLADCEDPDCAADPSCAPPEEICGNGLDDDANGLSDCEDPACADLPDCEPPEEDCFNDIDDDGNGLIDCEDPWCGGLAECELDPEVCDDGLDNDRDALTDCEDTDCAGHASCFTEGEHERCDNGVDDDGDGDIDCDDLLCAGDAACNAGESCFNGVDDNADGLTDCADPGCRSLAACTMPVGIWAFDAEQRRRQQYSFDRLTCPVPFSSEWRVWLEEESYVSFQTVNLSGVAIAMDPSGSRVVCPFQIDEQRAISERRHISSPEVPGSPELRMRLQLRRGFRTTPGCPLTEADLPPAFTGGYSGELRAIEPPSPGYFPEPVVLVAYDWLGIAGTLEPLPTGVTERNETTQERHTVDGVEVWCERVEGVGANAGYTPISTPSREAWPWNPFPTP